MSARLVPLSHAGVSPTIPLHRPVLLIGRHPDCDVRIELPQISRRHCCLALAYDRLLIRDLGSRHGVRVNGRPVDEQRLQPGDEVAIGPLIFRLDAPTPAPAPRAPSPPPPKPGARPVPETRVGTIPDIPVDSDGGADFLPLSGLFPPES